MTGVLENQGPRYSLIFLRTIVPHLPVMAKGGSYLQVTVSVITLARPSLGVFGCAGIGSGCPRSSEWLRCAYRAPRRGGSRISARGGRQGNDDLIWDGDERFLIYANTDLQLFKMFIDILCLNGVEQPFKRHQCPFCLPSRRGAGPSVPGVGARPSPPPLDPRLRAVWCRTTLWWAAVDGPGTPSVSSVRTGEHHCL